MNKKKEMLIGISVVFIILIAVLVGYKLGSKQKEKGQKAETKVETLSVAPTVETNVETKKEEPTVKPGYKIVSAYDLGIKISMEVPEKWMVASRKPVGEMTREEKNIYIEKYKKGLYGVISDIKKMTEKEINEALAYSRILTLQPRPSRGITYSDSWIQTDFQILNEDQYANYWPELLHKKANTTVGGYPAIKYIAPEGAKEEGTEYYLLRIGSTQKILEISFGGVNANYSPQEIADFRDILKNIKIEIL